MKKNKQKPTVSNGIVDFGNEKIKTLDRYMEDMQNTLRLGQELTEIIPTPNVKVEIRDLGEYNGEIVHCIIVNGQKCLTRGDVAIHSGESYQVVKKHLNQEKKSNIPFTEGLHYIYLPKNDLIGIKDVGPKWTDIDRYLLNVLKAPGEDVELLTLRGLFRLSSTFHSDTAKGWIEWLAIQYEFKINEGTFEQQMDVYFREKYKQQYIVPKIQIGNPSKNYMCCTGEMVQSRAEQNCVKALIANHVHYQINAPLSITEGDVYRAGLTLQDVIDGWGYIPNKIEPDFFFLNVPSTVMEYWGGMNDPRRKNYPKQRFCKEKIYSTLEPNPLKLIGVEPEEANSIPTLIEKIEHFLEAV